MGVRLADPLNYATALVSLLGAGRVAVPLDPAAPAAEVARVLAVARPVPVVSDGPEGLPPGLPVLPPPGRAGTPGAGPARPAGGPDLPGAGPSRRLAGSSCARAGPPGRPRGSCCSEQQLTHVAVGVAIHHRLTPADRGYCCLPLFHVNAEVVGLLATLAARACLVLDRRFSRRGFWAAIEDKQVTWINAVPAIITVLAADPAAAPSPGLVRFVRSASAPLPPSVLGRFERAFGIPVVETYGMTEAASMITANPLHGPRKAGSAGLPAGAEVRIVQREVGSGTSRARPAPSAGCRSGAAA